MMINSVNNGSAVYFGRMPRAKISAPQNISKSDSQWDICYKYEYPYNVLCNFHSSNFIFDDTQINSMEGFLQSLKFEDENVRKGICALPGFLAKKAGNYAKRSGLFDGENLYLADGKINRNSPEYQNLLDSVYEAKYMQDKEFRSVLELSKGYKLTHIIGKSDPRETILTEDEFIDRLNSLRQEKGIKDSFKIIKADLSKKPDSIKEITGKLKGLKTSFINSKLIYGQSPFNTSTQGLSDIKKTGIKNIIDINASAEDSKQREYLCSGKGLNYFNFKTDFNGKNNSVCDNAVKLTEMINSGDISYICCKKREDANDILILNYLLNPQANLSNALVFGTPRKSHLNQISNSIITELTSKPEKLTEIDEDFIKDLNKRKVLLHEINK